MLTEELNPVVLKCAFYDGYAIGTSGTTPRTVYDYEFEYFVRSEGGITTDGCYLPVKAGDFLIRTPGMQTFCTHPVQDYLLCVDFSGNLSKRSGYVLGSPAEAQPRWETPILSQLPRRIPAGKTDYLGTLMEQIYRDFMVASPMEQLSIKSSVFLLLREIHRIVHEGDFLGAIHHRRIQDCVRFILENYSQPLNVSQLIEASGLSKAHFHKLFRESMHQTPAQYITSVRLQQAKHLLLTDSLPVSQVAEFCGYYDVAYFCYLFKKNVGLTPGEYRRGMR